MVVKVWTGLVKAKVKVERCSLEAQEGMTLTSAVSACWVRFSFSRNYYNFSLWTSGTLWTIFLLLSHGCLPDLVLLYMNFIILRYILPHWPGSSPSSHVHMFHVFLYASSDLYKIWQVLHLQLGPGWEPLADDVKRRHRKRAWDNAGYSARWIPASVGGHR